MGSESRLCGWHLPPIEPPNVAETRPKIKCPQRVVNRMKYKTKASEVERFQHFSDAGRYIDEYRKRHSVAGHGTMEWDGSNVVNKRIEERTGDEKFSKYIDIRVPEKKICLTGLPQLRPPPSKHVLRTHAIHETTEESPFLAGVPHLPNLKLSGATKTVVKRETNRNGGQKHKKTHRKKKQGRLPYLKPPELEM